MSFDGVLDAGKLEITRRRLLKIMGGGLLVMVAGPAAFGWEKLQRGGPAIPQTLSAWIHVGTDGRVTVLTGKVEVGQNARTSLTQAAAEELRVPVESVTLVMGDTDLVPYDMGTFGSQTTPRMVPQIRKAAATARETLLDLAAKKMNADRAKLRASNGNIVVEGRTVTYAELAKEIPADRAVDPKVALTPNAEWQTLGKPIPKVAARDIVTGKHRYSADMVTPGMLHAKILRAPSYGATITSIDTSAAEAMPGVKVVRDGDFVGVAAPTVRLAEKALQAIKVEWKEVGGPSSKDMVSVLRGLEPVKNADAPAGSKALKATYSASYIAHVPLEPRAALASWDGSKMTVYTGTQRPFGVRPEVAKALGISENNVRVLVPDTGAAYGGKHTGDAAVEAARVSKAIGKPIKLVWTRIEEFTFAYFRPGGVDELYGAVSTEGVLVAWECDNYNSGSPGIETPYDVSSPRTESHRSDSPLRQGSYRCLGATFNNFARESHMDDLAHSAGLDPLEFRLKNLSRNPQLAEALKAAADKFGWEKTKPAPGRGFGLACGTEKGGYVATVAEVEINPETKAIRVVRQVTAFQCGKILNPDGLKNQVEGAVIMGMGGALFESIEFGNGKILNPHLAQYRVPRYSDIPQIETVLIDRPDLPSSGAGEVPIMSIAPAIGNAVFNATGIRLRSMPMKLPM